MILHIDTTDTKNIITELIDTKSKKSTRLITDQKIGTQVLLPQIIKTLKDNKMTLNDITKIEVNPGPGSFTGTRVGVAVANALGFALSAPVNGKKGKIVLPVYEKSKFDL